MTSKLSVIEQDPLVPHLNAHAFLHMKGTALFVLVSCIFPQQNYVPLTLLCSNLCSVIPLLDCTYYKLVIRNITAKGVNVLIMHG